MTGGNEPSKIIVDSDWKAKVEAEREAHRRKPAATEPETSETASGAPAPQSATGSAERRSDDDRGLPPPSFLLLVSQLSTEALVLMGALVPPDAKEPIVQLPAAKHHIDLLAVLEQKTKGNLDAQESSFLARALHELRMAYVEAVHRHAATKKP